jgi:hypothetical protein
MQFEFFDAALKVRALILQFRQFLLQAGYQGATRPVT